MTLIPIVPIVLAVFLTFFLLVAALAARLNTPRGIAIDAAGNIYVADSGNNRVRKISSGVITTAAGNGEAGWSGDGGLATDARISGPAGVALDTAGSLFISDANNHRIRKITNAVISTVAGAGPSA